MCCIVCVCVCVCVYVCMQYGKINKFVNLAIAFLPRLCTWHNFVYQSLSLYIIPYKQMSDRVESPTRINVKTAKKPDHSLFKYSHLCHHAYRPHLLQHCVSSKNMWTQRKMSKHIFLTYLLGFDCEFDEPHSKPFIVEYPTCLVCIC